MWGKLDDKAHENAKLQELDPDAGWLWTMMLSRCCDNATEGVVSARDVRQLLGLLKGVDEVSVQKLVDARSWHSSSTFGRCKPCRAFLGRPLKKGEFYIHDWIEYQFTEDESKLPEKQWKRLRNNRLKNDKKLRTAVYQRDHGRCRYCGIKPDFRDRSSLRGGTYDHVDPEERGNRLENIVVACRGCNSTKNDRDPDEAGMPLSGGSVMTPPEPKDFSGSDLAAARSQPGLDLATRAGGARDRVGPGLDQASDQDASGTPSVLLSSGSPTAGAPSGSGSPS